MPFLLFSWREEWVSEAAGSQPEGYHDVKNIVLPLPSCFHCAPWPEAPLGNTAKAEPRPAGEGFPVLSPPDIKTAMIAPQGGATVLSELPSQGHRGSWAHNLGSPSWSRPFLRQTDPHKSWRGSSHRQWCSSGSVFWSLESSVREGMMTFWSLTHLPKGLRRWALCDEGRRGLVLSFTSVHHSFVY